MLYNYIITAWRNLLKNKVYSVLNIAGLASGMAVALLIGLWVGDEITFNQYHKNHDRIAAVMTTGEFNGETVTYPNIVVPLEQELRTRFADDFKRLSLIWHSTNILAVGNTKISRQGTWAQPELPDMLTLEMLHGSRASFNNPSTLLLSQSVATALFGKEDPVNKVVKVDNLFELKVGGVFKDLPVNSHYSETTVLLPWDHSTNYWNKQTSDWDNHGSELVVQLHDKADINLVNAKIRDIINPHVEGYKEYTSLHPMDKWHLYTDPEKGKVGEGRIQYVWLFGIIGVFILLLACINFMNLSTARSEKRAKEVGIRKAVGSLRRQLTTQFLSESLVAAFLSFVITIVLVQLSLPWFNTLANKQISIPWGNGLFWLSVTGVIFLTGLIAGSYPAFYLSGFKPVKVLKGISRAGRLATLPRKVLVVFQFTISIVLIIGTIIVYRQVQYAKNRPVGYSREGLISIVMNTPELYRHYDALRHELIENGGAADMAQSNTEATEVWSQNSGMEWKGKDPGTDPLFGTIAVTHDYGNTVGWKIVAGRDFSREFPTDSSAFILNESAVKLAGLTNPVGTIIKWQGRDRQVVGVVKDMVMESPYRPTIPSIFLIDYGWLRRMMVRIKPDLPVREALAKMEKVFQQYNPGSPFEYQFVDEAYARKFANEERAGNLATFFAAFAIFISCLGLFGLASFVAEQRTKELGVRKVLGASVVNLWQLLSKDFVVLVLIGCLVAIPLAYYFMHQWLQTFEYRTSLDWWVFAISIGIAFVVTLLTVSFQSIKAALANPVKSLRTE